MPRYFFDLHTGKEMIVDEDGADLEPSQVRREAIAALPDVTFELLEGSDTRDFSVAVRDEHGRVVFRVALSVHAYSVR